ncbi:MAG: M14 metallopeptidase family protein, partial [Candidatus Aminicenantales bacterium]
MKRSRLFIGIAYLILACAILSAQTIPTPEAFFGHKIGADAKMVRWDKLVDYFRLATKASDRVVLQDLGKTTNGNPFVLLIISSSANLKGIEAYKKINRRIFDPRLVSTDEEARSLVREGKLFVLVSCSMHASEVGATQMSPEAVFRLATDDSPEIRKILDNVVFLLIPCLNPDGEIMVTDWYNKTVGTPFEDAPLPWLYHPYIGHDNNRDAYMFTQIETRLIGQVLYKEWFPEVWLDMHQMGSGGARIFVMPAMDPINPNVDPLIYRYAGILGNAQAAALERAGKNGIITNDMYTYWWEGAMGWAGW